MQDGKKIGVGIIGYEVGRSWAALAHVPALKGLSDRFEIAAVSTTRQESAAAAAADIGIERGYSNAEQLIRCPEVDLVAVTVKVPHHHELVKAATAAGKHVYCEWPLGNGLREAEEMAAMVRAAGVHGIVGLQARCAPVIAYVRSLIASGHIGEVLSTTMVGSGLQWADWVDPPNVYLLDKRNGATLLSIPLGHAVDALCHCLGEFASLSSITAIRQPKTIRLDTRQPVEKTAEDQVVVSGILESGAVASIHYRAGQSRGVNFLWEINGSQGDLQITATGGHAQMFELQLSGGQGKERSLSPMTVPPEFRWIPPAITGFGVNVAQMYARVADDLRCGTTTAPGFDDAVIRHRLLAAIEEAAATGRRVSLK
ncbi:gfo/Idh/MocA family oxidoreductase [Niveispirillum sp. SYP-B3756]|uniref:Gfo/Idh/MocA family protein n=1 Tax=Niveispirillum sp. SYP-B3756 TaxID=2662178 RepID=UPI001292754B|nr:Gfo/Idh/MocA family oxidoreductase [Niveispirillum sp. SYP-B3756]MQP68614.1 gfo/Idh/MocA family oxidoreductase [Niveispirillum sp. SYP-B3756]